jgi:hypothetical protein
MGFLGKLFGTEKDMPALDPASPGAKRIEQLKGPLEAFVGKLHDPVELIPASPGSRRTGPSTISRRW